MKPTFSEVAKTKAYQEEASASSQAHIFVSLLTALAFMLLSNSTFGLWWVVIFPSLLFFASVAIALPSMLLQIWLGLALSENPAQAKLISTVVYF